MSLEYYADGDLWVASGDGWRTGVRCWHECDDVHIEIVYQELRACDFVDVSNISAIDKVMWERLVKYGTFLINSMEETK